MAEHRRHFPIVQVSLFDLSPTLDIMRVFCVKSTWLVDSPISPLPRHINKRSQNTLLVFKIGRFYKYPLRKCLKIGGVTWASRDRDYALWVLNFLRFFQAKTAVLLGRSDVIVGDVTSSLPAERSRGGKQPACQVWRGSDSSRIFYNFFKQKSRSFSSAMTSSSVTSHQAYP